MKYWSEFNSRLGFDDGARIPEDAEHFRKYIEELNKRLDDIAQDIVDDEATWEIDGLAGATMEYRVCFQDEITESTHQATMKRGGHSTVTVKFDDGKANEHVGIEVHDGRLKVHIWTEGRDEPASLSIPFTQLMDPALRTPEFGYLGNE